MQRDGVPDCERIQIGNRTTYSKINNDKNINEDGVDFSQFFDESESTIVDNSPIREDISHSKPKKSSYKFTSMFWLYNDDNIECNCDIVNISYNINFSNLRLSFYNFPNEGIKKYFDIDKVLFFNHLQNIANITIYPTDCFKLLSDLCNSFQFIEPLFYNKEAWQFERPITHVEKTNNNNEIKMSIWTNESNGYNLITEYIFNNINFEILKYACNFVINGGFTSSINHANKN